MEGLKLPPRVKDISGGTINNLKVLSYAGRNENKIPLPTWRVECPCGRIVTMTKTCINKNVSGCGSCLNEVEEFEDYLLVNVSTEKYPNTYTKVDKSFIHLFANVRWHVYVRSGEYQTMKYVRTNSDQFISSELHRVVLGNPAGLVCDHISGDTLDNRSKNLRAVTSQENSKNCKKGINNTTGRLGVSVTPKGKFRAYINVGSKQIHLGHFELYEDAVLAREDAEILYGFHKNHGRVGNS